MNKKRKKNGFIELLAVLKMPKNILQVNGEKAALATGAWTEIM